MKLIRYEEREKMKLSGIVVHRFIAHYHNFLESCYGHWDDDNFEPQVDLAEYTYWIHTYPGWLCGKLDREHSAWNKKYKGKHLPMNKVLRKREGNSKTIASLDKKESYDISTDTNFTADDIPF